MRSSPREAGRRLRFSALLVLAIAVVGSLGYRVIEGWGFFDSFYMVFITMSTVGFGEIHPLSPIGRLWTIALVISGVGALGYSAASLVEFLLEGYFSGSRKERRMNQRIARMSGHTILCGYGRVGRQIAEDLAAAGVEFIVIDRQDLGGELARGDIPHIIGAAELEETLVAAGIGQAKVLVSAVDSDTENVFIALSARDLNSTLRIIARARNAETVRKLELVGADRVVSPYTTSGRRMAHLALHPAATDVFDVLGGPLGGLSVEMLQLELRGGELVGRSLSELDLRQRSGALVVALATEGRLELNPDPGRQLRPGDVLTVLGTEEQCQRLHEMNR